MKIFREYLIVKVPSIFIEESSYKGVDGKSIMLNVLFNPERHVRNYGIVTSVPDELHEFPLVSNSISAPGYHDYPVFDWKTNTSIELEIKEGDKVYFHNNCLLPDENGGNQWNKMFITSIKENGVYWHYFMVKYDLVYAAIRYEAANNTVVPFEWSKESELKPLNVLNENKQKDSLFFYTDLRGFDQIYRKTVAMIGSYVFVEPDIESWEDISIPTPEVFNGKKLLNPDGSVRMKPKEQWIVTKKMPEEKYLRGWVRFCGSPLKGDREFLRPGMYVYFQRFANTKLTFEGFDYFRMRQRHIFGIAPYKQLHDEQGRTT